MIGKKRSGGPLATVAPDADARFAQRSTHVLVGMRIRTSHRGQERPLPIDGASAW